jgi:hypothetical protein
MMIWGNWPDNCLHWLTSAAAKVEAGQITGNTIWDWQIRVRGEVIGKGYCRTSVSELAVLAVASGFVMFVPDIGAWSGRRGLRSIID